jgi:hypothetical protein
MTQPNPLDKLDAIGHEIAQLRDRAEQSGNTPAVAELARLSAKIAATQARIFEAIADADELARRETEFGPSEAP